MPSAAEYEAAGLYDPSSAGAADRLELLDWLAGQGCSIDDMTKAAGEGQLASLAADRRLLGGSPISHVAAADASGIELEMLERILRASGFTPDRAALTTETVDLFRQFAAARALFSDDEILHFTRVMGSSLARIADAANTLFLLDVELPMRSSKPTELEMAKTQLFAVELLDVVDVSIAKLFRLHMDAAIGRSREARKGSSGLEVAPMAVGFVDLVGYTSLTETATTHELLDLVLHFEGRAYDLVAEHGGRVVKLIGDEVMYTAVSARAAASIALALVEELRARGDVAPRGGIAYGYVLSHGGDCYGSTVNLASRVADVAVPWEVLVTEALASRLDGRFGLEPAGRRMLKGFAEPVALRSLLPG